MAQYNYNGDRAAYEETQSTDYLNGRNTYRFKFPACQKKWLETSYSIIVSLFDKSHLNIILNRGNGIIGTLRFNAKNWNVTYSYDYSIFLISFNASHEIHLGVV